MIGFTNSPNKIVMIVFFALIAFILLTYVDTQTNNYEPEEEILISKNLDKRLPDLNNKIIHKVKEGENLSVIFEDKKVPLNTAYKIFNFDKNNILSGIKPNDLMEFNYLGDKLRSIEIIKDEVNSILISTSEEIFVKTIKKDVQKINYIRKGVIDESFYKDALKIGIPDSIIMDFAYIFGWDVDFIFDIRKGDVFSVIYEIEYSNGSKISNGDIIFAEFMNQNKTYVAQRFYDKDQGKQYFNESGDNVKKAFLRAPLDFAYISSHFNPNRMHPILHRIKAHNGVDYAAKRNTPVKASGDGTISFVGRKSGYGRTVEIKHGGNIKTLYAHLEKFKLKLKVGDKVKQGEVIAFVGDSGQATGTHLHFEFWQGSTRTDPVKVKLPSAKAINSNQYDEFRDLLTLSFKSLDEYNLLVNE
tara:strand:+ start:675 stop:1919 length:1245 start_codon:yes stop_codon:yes gene_type:complete